MSFAKAENFGDMAGYDLLGCLGFGDIRGHDEMEAITRGAASGGC